MSGGKFLQKGEMQYSATFHGFNIIIYRVWAILGDGSGLTGENNAWEIDIVIGHVIDHVCVEFIAIAAGLVFCWCIIADYIALFLISFVEDFSVDMQESPILEGEMGHWIFSSRYSRLEVVHSVELVEPCSEFTVSHARAAVVIELNHFELVCH